MPFQKQIMKKRSFHSSKPSITKAGDATTATTLPSSPSSSSSSSSCVVDYHPKNDDNQVNNNNNEDEDEKPPKPKRTRRKKAAINPKAEKCDTTNRTTNAATTTTPNRRSSIYRGVTRHRWTGRFEAHLWDKSSWNNIQNKKGRQVYLGAYDSEVDAARTYDLAALKYWGPQTTLNFPIENYTKEVEEMQNASKEEYLASLRRRSSGFSRGVSKYRGVARHHHNGRWEARIGRVFGNKYLYLGTFSSQEEAAAAYDLAAIEYRGPNAVTNFDISNYIGRVKNLMPKIEPPLPISNQTKPIVPQQQQEQKIKRQLEEEEQQDQPPVKHRDLAEILEEKQEQQVGIPSQLEEAKLTNSIDHNPSMLRMDDPEDDRENPWSFCLDAGSYDPLLVPDIPFEEDGSLLDLFDQTGFEDNIDMIFEGEGNLITIDDSFFEGTEVLGCPTSEELNNKIEILPKVEDTFSSFFLSSSPSSPSSTTSLVSCQL